MSKNFLVEDEEVTFMPTCGKRGVYEGIDYKCCVLHFPDNLEINFFGCNFDSCTFIGERGHVCIDNTTCTFTGCYFVHLYRISFGIHTKLDYISQFKGVNYLEVSFFKDDNLHGIQEIIDDLRKNGTQLVFWTDIGEGRYYMKQELKHYFMTYSARLLEDYDKDKSLVFNEEFADDYYCVLSIKQ